MGAADLTWVESGRTWLLSRGPDFLLSFVAFLAILLVGGIVIAVVSGILRRVLVSASRVSEILEKDGLSR